MRTVMLVGWVVCGIAASVGAMVATLDVEALMALDHYPSNLLGGQVLDQEPVLGGVRFDVRFPGAGALDTQVFYTSAFDVDLSDFEALALTFSVVSVEGVDAGAEVGVYASPFIRDTAGVDHYWELAYLDATASGTSITQSVPVSVLAVGHTQPGDQVQQIGFDVRIESDALGPDGMTLGLLVTPAPGATAIPEPASLLLMTTGVVLLSRKR